MTTPHNPPAFPANLKWQFSNTDDLAKDIQDRNILGMIEKMGDTGKPSQLADALLAARQKESGK